MTSNFIFLVEKTSESVAYKMGYEVGYFIAGHIYLIIAAFLVILASFIYFIIFRRKRKT